MVLVYTNSKERAMLMAAHLDGVVLHSKIKINDRNYNEYKVELDKELTEAGYIMNFFQGEAHAFIYSNGAPCAPAKMPDYAPEYADVSKRPVPFIPEVMKQAYIDPEFVSHLDMYRQMYSDASRIINAASDDIAGELAFHAFTESMNSCLDPRYVFRARPAATTPSSIISAFNAMEEVHVRHGYEAACLLRQSLHFLVSCNASNLLTQLNYEKKIVVTGLLESAVLTLLAERFEEIHSKRPPSVYVTVALDEQYVEAAVALPAGITMEAAKQIVAECKAQNTVTLEKDNSKIFSRANKLPSVFSIQSEMGDLPSSISIKQAADALIWLYENGYITWPGPQSNLPWSAKLMFAASVNTLKQLPQYANIIMPSDVDNFLGWDSSTSTQGRSSPMSGCTGIMLTTKLPDNSMPDDARVLYDAIAETNLNVLKYHAVQTISDISFKCGNYTLRAIVASPINKKGPVIEQNYPCQPEGKVCPIVDVCIKNEPPKQYTESEVISILCAAAGAPLFSNEAHTFSTVINNLITWKQIVKDSDGSLRITKNGLLAYKYIRGTSLSDIYENLLWEQRLTAVAEGTAAPAQCAEDITAYVKDICEELSARAKEIAELGGKTSEDFKCPICGHGLVPCDTGWACENPRCKFIIPASLYGHTVSKLDVLNLICNGRTSLLLDCKSSKGIYAARAVLKDGKILRSFQSPHICPKCKSTYLNEYLWGLKCPEQKCSFSMNTTVCKRRLSEEEVSIILKGGTTKGIRMTNSSGKDFVAKLCLDEDMQIKFIFPKPKEE